MMILAGEAVGELGRRLSVPLPYRGQAEPVLPDAEELAAGGCMREAGVFMQRRPMHLGGLLGRRNAVYTLLRACWRGDLAFRQPAPMLVAPSHAFPPTRPTPASPPTVLFPHPALPQCPPAPVRLCCCACA